MYNFNQTKEDKDKILEWLRGEYRSISTGRATPQVLDLVHIDMYGTRTQIAHAGRDRKSTRLNSSHLKLSRMPSSA